MLRNIISKIVLVLTLLPLLGVFVHTAEAATLSAVKDTITTSRPSASWYLSSDYATTDTTVSMTGNSTSRYLASDSARLISGNGTPLGSAVVVASQSADLKTVYLANSSGTAAKTPSDILIVPITAKHTFVFTTVTSVASTGKIVITFPGSGSNIASPSASTFSFNGLASANINTTFSSGTTTCGSYTISAPTITCNLATAGINPGVTVTMVIGNSTPALINPTKSNTAGSNDSWRVTVQTTDSGGLVLDDAKIAIGTIDSVKVTADVDPSLTFTIAGVAPGTTLSGISSTTSVCGDTTTAGLPAATATEVNLGSLRNAAISIAAQRLTVSTNGAQGYTISATSSGRMINPATGFWLYGLNGDTLLSANDTPVPATFRASGFEGFGISACGSHSSTIVSSQWGGNACATGFSSGCKYSNPYNVGTASFYSTITSYTGGAVSSDDTIVKYAGTVSGTTPPGTYRTMFTYVATATF